MAVALWMGGQSAILRRLAAGLLAGSLAAGVSGACGRAMAAGTYDIDQRNGSITFVVSAFGVADIEGRFGRFTGRLWLDEHDPARSRIDVTIDAEALEMPSGDEISLLRSPPYLDTARFPQDGFASTEIRAIGPGHYAVDGLLRLRGVTRPQRLDAVLLAAPNRPAGSPATADFAVSGELRRSDFGMVADQALLSDTVRLRIRIRLALRSGGDAG